MKRLYIILLPICCSFYVTEPSCQDNTKNDNRLAEIEKETSDLQTYKKALQARIDVEHHRELHQEMEGQRSMLEYQWHDVSKEMKSAEAAEKKSQRLEAELECLNRRLTKVLAEKEAALKP